MGFGRTFAALKEMDEQTSRDLSNLMAGLRKGLVLPKIEEAWEDSGYIGEQEANFLDPDEAEFEPWDSGTAWPPTGVVASVPAGCSATVTGKAGRQYLRLVSGPTAAYPVLYYPFADWKNRGAVPNFSHLFSLVAMSESGDAEMVLYAQTAETSGGANAVTIAEGEPALVEEGGDPARPSVGPYDVTEDAPFVRFAIGVSDPSTILVGMQQQEKAKPARPASKGGTGKKHKKPGPYKPPSHKAASVRSRHVRAANLLAAHIANNNVQEQHIPDGHVRTRHHLAGNVNANALAESSVVSSKLGSQSVGSGAMALAAILGSHVASGQLIDAHFPQWNFSDVGTWGTGLNTFTVRPNAIWDPHILDNTMTQRGHHPNQRGGPDGQYALRTLNVDSTSAQKFCFGPFRTYPREERLRRLENRREVREADSLTPEFNRQNFERLVEGFEKLKRLVLEVSHHTYDYQNMSGDEFEEWVLTDDPEARAWRANVLTHEYPEEHEAYWQEVYDEAARQQKRVLAESQVLAEKARAEHATEQKRLLEKARLELAAAHAADRANHAALRQRTLINDLKREEAMGYPNARIRALAP